MMKAYCALKNTTSLGITILCHDESILYSQLKHFTGNNNTVSRWKHTVLSVTVLHWEYYACVIMKAYCVLSNSASLGITILRHDESILCSQKRYFIGHINTVS